MTNKLLHLNVTTKDGRSFWFEFLGDPKYLPEWREAGLVVEEIVSSCPQVIGDSCLLKPWLWLQAIFNFRLPWRL